MNKLVLFLVTALLSITLNAQYHYEIYSLPDGAEVNMNGDQKCTTPCRVKFYWKDNVNDKIVFTVTATRKRNLERYFI